MRKKNKKNIRTIQISKTKGEHPVLVKIILEEFIEKMITSIMNNEEVEKKFKLSDKLVDRKCNFCEKIFKFKSGRMKHVDKLHPAEAKLQVPTVDMIENKKKSEETIRTLTEFIDFSDEELSKLSSGTNNTNNDKAIEINSAKERVAENDTVCRKDLEKLNYEIRKSVEEQFSEIKEILKGSETKNTKEGVTDKNPISFSNKKDISKTKTVCSDIINPKLNIVMSKEVKDLIGKDNTIVPTIGNGGCGMSAVSVAILGDCAFGRTLRKALNKHTVNNFAMAKTKGYSASSNSPFFRKVGAGVTSKDVTFKDENALKSWLLSEESELMWTNDLDLEMLSDILDININIITTKGRMDKKPDSVTVGNPKNKGVTIKIINYSNTHFDAIVSNSSNPAQEESISDMILNELTAEEIVFKKNLKSIDPNTAELAKKIRSLEKEKKVDLNNKFLMQRQFHEMENKLREFAEKEEVVKLKESKLAELEELRMMNQKKETFRKVMVMSSGEDDSEIEESFEDSQFTCNSCDFQTYTERRLKRHIKHKHTARKVPTGDFLCEQCDERSSSTYDLNNHMKNKHKGIKDSSAIPCKQCDESFSSIYDVNKHMISAHNSRICRFFLENRCKFEEYCFFKHERVDKDEPNFACNICKETFDFKHHLMIHRKKSHPNIILPCRNFLRGMCHFKTDICWYNHTNKVKNNLDFFPQGKVSSPKIFGGGFHKVTSGSKTTKMKKRGKRKNNANMANFNIMGVNVDGVRGKLTSLRTVIHELKPQVLFLQETKLNTKGILKIKGFQILEKNRPTNKKGGGIALAFSNVLDPMLVSEGPEDIEIMSAIAKVGKSMIRFCVGYGPQESDSKETKEKFWAFIDNDFKEAKKNQQLFCLQMDSNAWGGPNLIPGDKRPQNCNGKYLEELLNRNPDLVLANALPQCEGLITRRRVVNKVIQESSIDMIIICKGLKDNLISMKIDEDREFVLSNFKQGKTTESDHNVMVANFNLNFKQNSKVEEIINYKDLAALAEFKKACSEEGTFTRIFKSNMTLEEKLMNFHFSLVKTIKECFKTIRIKKEKPIKPRQKLLILKRNSLKVNLNNFKKCMNCPWFDSAAKSTSSDNCPPCGKTFKKLNDSLVEAENKIAEDIAKDSADRIRLCLSKYEESSLGIADIGKMWIDFKNIGQPKRDTLDTIKVSNDGKELSKESEIVEALKNEVKCRLRDRDTRTDMKDLNEIQEEILEEILENAENADQREWVEKDIDFVLKRMKSRKARDPLGIVEGILKPQWIGSDLKKALLTLMNLIKKSKTVPKVLRTVNATFIPKKGSKKVIKNHRAIMNVVYLRSILMNLIYSRKYDRVEEHLSEFNIGARKEKNCLINIFAISAIINEVKNDKEAHPVNITVLDLEQFFDSMNLDKSISTLFKNGIDDDDLILIREANKEILISIKKGNTVSDPVTVHNVILQGDTLAPLISTTEMDQIARDWIERTKDEDSYFYRGVFRINSLGVIDDTIMITKAGWRTTLMNAFMNTKLAERGFRLAKEDKCKNMLVSHKDIVSLKNTLKFDKWVDTLENDGFEDNLNGKTDVLEVKHSKYLGVTIQEDSKNCITIKNKTNKAIGSIKTIVDKLNAMDLGKYYLEAAVLMRNSVLLGSLLYGTEVLNNLSAKDVKKLAKVDEDFWRNVLKTDHTVPKALIYLEIAIEDVDTIIRKRRLMFLKYILDQEEESLVKKIYLLQKRSPKKGDWINLVKEDLNALNIDSSEKVIGSMSKKEFKDIVDKKAKDFALTKYNNMKKKIKRLKERSYFKFEIQNYLTQEGLLTKNQLQNVFKIRTEGLDIAAWKPFRFEGKKNCPFGCFEEEDLVHLTKKCPVTGRKEEINLSVFKDGRNSHIKKNIKIFGKILDFRNDVLKKIEAKEKERLLLQKKEARKYSKNMKKMKTIGEGRGEGCMKEES